MDDEPNTTGGPTLASDLALAFSALLLVVCTVAYLLV